MTVHGHGDSFLGHLYSWPVGYQTPSIDVKKPFGSEICKAGKCKVHSRNRGTNHATDRFPVE